MHFVNISAQVCHRACGYDTTAGVAAHSAEDKEIPKGTREMYADIIEQWYFVATLK